MDSNPFGENTNIRLVKRLAFIVYERCIVQHIFLAYFPLNERMEILTIFDQNHGLTFLEKF